MSHCDEQGVSDGLWRYRHVWGLLPALITGIATLVAYSYGGPYFHTYTDSPIAHPMAKGIMSFALAWVFFSSLAEALYQRRRINVLLQAGIELSIRAPTPSFKELVRARKEFSRQYRTHCRRHGLRGHVYWATAQAGLSLFSLLFPVALILSGNARADAALGSAVVAGVVSALVVWAYIEWIYLERCWRKVNSCSVCPTDWPHTTASESQA